MELKYNNRSIPVIFFGLSILLNLALTVLLFANLNDEQIHVYFNSDTLYLPSIYRDLFIDKNGFAGWHLNGAPNFFPDMVLYFIIRPFFHQFIPAAFTFSLVQLLILLLLLGSVYKHLILKISYFHLAIGSLLMSLFLLETLIGNNFIYTFYLLSISYHMGAFIMCLLALLFTLKYYKEGKWLKLIPIFITVAVAVVNDRLFMAMYSLPLLSFLILLFKRTRYFRMTIAVLVINILGTATGMLLFNILMNTSQLNIMELGWKAFNFNNILPAASVFFNQHLTFMTQADIRGLIDLLFLISLSIHIYLLIQKLSDFFRGSRAVEDELIYLLFFISFSIIVLLMPVINGSYVAWSLFRYNIYTLYFGIFSYAFLFYKLQKKNVFYLTTVRYFNAVLLLAIIFLFIRVTHNEKTVKGLRAFLHFYPESVASVDSLARLYPMKNGLATYWDAKYISMFSKENLRVFTVFESLAPWYHVMNENWYYFEDGSKHTPRKFNFILMAGIEKESINKYLGSPEDTLCYMVGDTLLIFKPFQFNPEIRRPYYPEATEQFENVLQ